MSNYFEDYNRSGIDFRYQRKLCELIKRIDANFRIDSDNHNAMTMKLMSLQKAKEEIENQFNSHYSLMDSAYQGYTTIDFSYSAPLSAAPTYSLKPSRQMGAPSPDISLFNIYYYADNFFAAFGSSLDRAVFEIDKLYRLTLRKREKTWNGLRAKETHDGVVSSNNPNLGRYITGSRANYLSDLLEYRMRFYHDGFVRIKSSFPKRVRIRYYIPDDPLNDPDNCNRLLVPIIRNGFIALIRCINDIYRLVFNDLKTKKSLPL